MTGGVYITLFGAACTVSILNMAVTDDMCVTMTLSSLKGYTLHYTPNTNEPKTCCCTLSATDANVSVSISSNATYFELVFHTNGTVISLRNETELSLSYNIQFCATMKSDVTERGSMIIDGNTEFQVTCTFNTSVIVSTTVNVPLTTTTEESVTSNTGVVASGFSSIVIGIIIGSVAGVLVIITGVVMSCLFRHRKSRSKADKEMTMSESHPTYWGLTGGDNRVYDSIDTPHQDNDYYNVPENSEYQNP